MPDRFSRGGDKHSLYRWLEDWRFTDNPFAHSEAGREGLGLLAHLFVDRPYFKAVAGNPSVPETTFVLGGPGEGKTATLEYLVMLCAPGGEFYGQTLAVRLDDFAPLLERVDLDPARLTARDYAFGVARAIVKALAEDVPATYFDVLDSPQDRALLRLYIETFGDGMSLLRLSRIGADPPLEGLDFERLSPREIVQMLADLVCKLGQAPGETYRSLYVLVDRVDETPAGRDAVVALLRPLVAEGPLVQMKNLAFKFFLPRHEGYALLRETSLRRDRVRVENIDWDEHSLEEVIRQRLSHYSGGRFSDLSQLCRPGAGARVMERLIEASDRSPRRLLQLCHHLLEYHVEHSRDGSPFSLIDTYDNRADPDQFRPGAGPGQPPRRGRPAGRFHPAGGHPRQPARFGRRAGLHGRRGPDFRAGRAALPAADRQGIPPVQNTLPPRPGHRLDGRHQKRGLQRRGGGRDRAQADQPLAAAPDRGLTGQAGEIIHNVRGRGYWLNIA
jgi:hypothetical protein